MKLSDFKDKKVLIMGLGLHGGGTGAAKFFSKLGSRVTATDLKSKKELRPSLAELKHCRGIVYHLDGHRVSDFRQTDLVIKNPGVPDNSLWLKIARRAGAAILSDVEIFLRICPARVIGVTGTKGKSTAAWLVGEFLRKSGKKVWVGGNIRKSVLELLPKIKKSDWVVLELSSFQLDSLAQSRLSPHIAVITNIFPDHLNRYPDMRAYVAAKSAIFRWQTKGDWLFVSWRDNFLKRLARRAPSRVLLFDPIKIAKRFLGKTPKIPEYHYANIAAAVAVARHLGVGERVIRKVMTSFKGMAGRMELVRVVRGVEFINDTTATNPTAAEAAVLATKKRIRGHGLHVIAGGFDKGLPIESFVRTLRVKAATVIFLPGTATDKMESRIPPKFFFEKFGRVNDQHPKIYEAGSMSEAVKLAFREAVKGDTVLLSPGAASFGLFQHEFDRGKKFVEAVRRIKDRSRR